MRISQITILCITGLFVSCGTSVSPPTDDEMIQHFYAHESAFNQIKELVSMRPNSSYYPPYHPNDTTCLAGISIPTQQALDSLLREIKCKRIFYAVKTGRQEYEKEMPEVELCVQYFVSGYSVGGTTKEFVYSTTVVKQFEVIENRELNSIYQEQYNDTILYKSINGNWFIRLIYDN